MKRKKQNKNLLVVKNMPPLYHTLPGQKFDIRKSEVVRWLIEKDEILQLLFGTVVNQSGSKKLVEYNPNTGKWQGVDYESKK
ncbi:hypothetical protein [Erysipelothrix rhusiopathiae]|uniref:hypothetical protein n=1 Tax=Erysipelothrix rhusiopathiae TaxID=1648 RepID=UPI00200A59D5|nr:hypothetical protein [Erysipelothrix rhusiopathiae]MDE8283160.1 hypothetical protein [Erysipelothrix rhusiopathiae]UPU39317.1 hypothetical protein MX850_00445 [Erysipelothrix sp. Poltava]